MLLFLLCQSSYFLRFSVYFPILNALPFFLLHLLYNSELWTCEYLTSVIPNLIGCHSDLACFKYFFIKLFRFTQKVLPFIYYPGPFTISFISLYKINTGEWLIKNVGNTSIFKTDSGKVLGMKLYTRRVCMKHKQHFYLKVNHFILGFIIIRTSHESKVSLIPINFATDFCLKDGLPPQHPRFVLKKTLKSPARKKFEFSFM